MIYGLLILCILFPIYVYVGYPLILFILSKTTTFTLPTDIYKKDISIVMIVCNEADNVDKKINNLLNLNYSGGEVKLIIVDDASNDETLSIIQSYGVRVHSISSPERLGKANGLNLAMAKIETELVMMVDCRQEIEDDALIYLSSWFERYPDMGGC